jgi:hypothetical protein
VDDEHEAAGIGADKLLDWVSPAIFFVPCDWDGFRVACESSSPLEKNREAFLVDFFDSTVDLLTVTSKSSSSSRSIALTKTGVGTAKSVRNENQKEKQNVRNDTREQLPWKLGTKQNRN